MKSVKDISVGSGASDWSWRLLFLQNSCRLNLICLQHTAGKFAFVSRLFLHEDLLSQLEDFSVRLSELSGPLFVPVDLALAWVGLGLVASESLRRLEDLPSLADLADPLSAGWGMLGNWSMNLRRRRSAFSD